MKKVLFAGAAFVAASFASAQFVGFETSEGFSVGALNGQNSWIAGSNTSVDTAQAHSGTQSVKMTGAGYSEYSWFNFGSPYSGAINFSTWVYINGADADNDRLFGLRMWDGATGGVSLTVTANGNVRSGSGSPWSLSSIGNVGGLTNRWTSLVILYNTGATTASVFVNGNLFNVSGLTAMTQVTDADLHTDWINTSTTAGTGWFDDYAFNAVPEPATMAVLAGVAAVVARRRRK